MTTVAVCSAKGSPGVSTACLALSLTWPRPVMLVDADPAGGDLLAGFFRGEQPAGRGVLALTLDARRSSMRELVWLQVLPLTGAKQAWLLPGVSSPKQVRSVDWPEVAAILPGLQHHLQPVDALVDLGRLRPESEATRPDSPGPEPLLRTAELVVIALGGSLASVRAGQLRVEQLQALMADRLAGASRLVGLLIGGPRPYGEGEIARALGIPIVSALPHDTRTAGTLMAGAPARRGWRAAPLMRAASMTADLLVELADAQRVEAAPAPVRKPVPWVMANEPGGWTSALPSAPSAVGGDHGG